MVSNRRRRLATLAVSGAALVFVVSAPAATSRANRRVAERDAAVLVARVRLPLGATCIAGGPPGQPRQPMAARPAGVRLVTRRSWWRVPGTFAAVVMYIRRHVPAGANWEGPGIASGLGIGPNESVTFAWPAVPGVLGLRGLVATVTELPSGQIAVSADAEVQWIIPRPATEQIPAGLGALDVTVGVPGAPPAVSVQTSDPRTVGRIRDLIDRLQIVQPGETSCPALTAGEPLVTFSFREGPGGPVVAAATELAQAREPTTACDPLDLQVRGRWEDPLLGGAAVVRDAQRLLGVSLTASAPDLGEKASSQDAFSPRSPFP